MTPRTDFEDRFAETGKNIDSLLADAKEEYRDERQALKDRWNSIETRRKDIKDDSAWEEMKDDMESEWNDLKSSYEDLKTKLSGNK